MSRQPVGTSIATNRIHGIETTLVAKTIGFIASHLGEWRDDPDREDVESEDRLNLQLCDYLDGRARELFPMVRFTREEPQTGRRSSDLAAKPATRTAIRGRLYTRYDAFLSIEGKRLPAPSNDREQEYVTGGKKITGGIQRFKLGQHGARDAVALLVGYIQQGDATLWRKRVNAWIGALAKKTEDTCTWCSSEILRETQGSFGRGVSAHESTHGRNGNVASTKIELRHLWVCMHMRRATGRTAKETHANEGNSGVKVDPSPRQ